MALSSYPARPAEGETGWFDKRETYDEVVEDNISEAHTVASDAKAAAEGSVQSDNVRLPIAMTKAAFDALPVKVDGQIYFTTGS